MNKAAQTLGRLAKGKPKKYTPEEIKARTERLKQARAKRWSKSRTKPQSKNHPTK